MGFPLSCIIVILLAGESPNCTIVQLPDMRPIDDVTSQLWHDVTPQQRLK